MACNHNSFSGVCTYFDENDTEIDPNLGADTEGYCMCEDDEYPTNSCTYYESDDEEEESEYTLEALDAGLDIK